MRCRVDDSSQPEQRPRESAAGEPAVVLAWGDAPADPRDGDGFIESAQAGRLRSPGPSLRLGVSAESERRERVGYGYAGEMPSTIRNAPGRSTATSVRANATKLRVRSSALIRPTPVRTPICGR